MSTETVKAQGAVPDSVKGKSVQPTVAPSEAKITRIPGVQLEVVPGKEVIVRVPGLKQSYRGKIVGFDPFDFIIAKVRLPSNVRNDLAFGGQLVMKYVHKGTIYGFKASVQNVVTSPSSLVIFDYPDMIEKLDLRQTSRHKCSIDAVLHTTDDEVDCLVVNVSESGCKISARAGSRSILTNTKVDDALIVSMNLGKAGELKLAVAVKNIFREKGIVYFGCMFLDISKQEMATINTYLDKLSRLTR